MSQPVEPFRIIADHPDFVAIDKPAGVSVHRDDADEGLVTQLERQLGGDKLYLVHRLDRMTSGVLLLARSAQACAGLAALFAARRIDQFYVALAEQTPKRKQGLVRGDMERSRNGSWRLARSLHNPALTQFFSYGVEPGLRLFILKPATGRTHQLRVAMKSLGAPIAGDLRYGGSAADRGYLHAMVLAFEWHGEPQSIVAMPQQGELFQRESVGQAVAVRMPFAALAWPALPGQPMTAVAEEDEAG